MIFFLPLQDPEEIAELAANMTGVIIINHQAHLACKLFCFHLLLLIGQNLLSLQEKDNTHHI